MCNDYHVGNARVDVGAGDDSAGTGVGDSCVNIRFCLASVLGVPLQLNIFRTK